MNDPYASLNSPDPVNSTKWMDMDVVQLREQISILTTRLNSLESIGQSINPTTLAMCRIAMETAMHDIEDIIAIKQQPKPPGTV